MKTIGLFLVLILMPALAMADSSCDAQKEEADRACEHFLSLPDDTGRLCNHPHWRRSQECLDALKRASEARRACNRKTLDWRRRCER